MMLPVAPSDLWTLRRKPRSQIMLYNETLLAQPHRPLWFALRCMIQGPGRDCAMVVHRGRDTTAVVQAQGRSNRPEQDVTYLAVYGARGVGLPSDRDIWFRLLEQLCFSAGQNYVQRLYASIANQNVEVHEVFRQVGFQAYARRAILQLSGPDWDQGTTLAPMRFQSRRDHWAIHKLYGVVTPHQVQRAEARNARMWALPLTSRWPGLHRRAWVLGPGDNLTAYLRIVSGSISHVISLLVHPEAREIVTDILRFGLAQLNDVQPVYLMLREYQSELMMPLQDLGFQPVGEQLLLVKNTVIPIRRSILLPALEPSLEPRVTAPRISTPREDAHSYARTT